MSSSPTLRHAHPRHDKNRVSWVGPHWVRHTRARTQKPKPNSQGAQTVYQFEVRHSHTNQPADPATMERVRQLVLAPAWTNVRIALDGDAPLQATGEDAKGRTQYVYHPDHTQGKKALKWERLDRFEAALPVLRRRINRAIEGDDTKARECALVLRLLDASCFRVGSGKDTGGEEDVMGATTLQTQNLRVVGNTLYFSFKGKGAKSQAHRITDALLAKELGKRLSNPPTQRLFRCSDGQVRAFLKSITPKSKATPGAKGANEGSGGEEAFIPHDFRGLHATRIARETIESTPRKSWPQTTSQLKKQQLAVAALAAKKLGNSPREALKSYISPSVWESWEKTVARREKKASSAQSKSQTLRKAGASGYPLQGRRIFRGLSVSIENKKGSWRVDKAHTPPHWKTRMLCDYGYLRQTEGVDGDHLDVFVGPNENARRVYVIRQNDPRTGKFDEQKFLLGFDTRAQAKRTYLAHYDSPRFLGGLSSMPFEEFKSKALSTLHGSKLVKAARPSPSMKKSSPLSKAFPGGPAPALALKTRSPSTVPRPTTPGSAPPRPTPRATPVPKPAFSSPRPSAPTATASPGAGAPPRQGLVATHVQAKTQSGATYQTTRYTRTSPTTTNSAPPVSPAPAPLASPSAPTAPPVQPVQPQPTASPQPQTPAQPQAPAQPQSQSLAPPPSKPAPQRGASAGKTSQGKTPQRPVAPALPSTGHKPYDRMRHLPIKQLRAKARRRLLMGDAKSFIHHAAHDVARTLGKNAQDAHGAAKDQVSKATLRAHLLTHYGQGAVKHSREVAVRAVGHAMAGMRERAALGRGKTSSWSRGAQEMASRHLHGASFKLHAAGRHPLVNLASAHLRAHEVKTQKALARHEELRQKHFALQKRIMAQSPHAKQALEEFNARKKAFHAIPPEKRTKSDVEALENAHHEVSHKLLESGHLGQLLRSHARVQKSSERIAGRRAHHQEMSGLLSRYHKATATYVRTKSRSNRTVRPVTA